MSDTSIVGFMIGSLRVLLLLGVLPIFLVLLIARKRRSSTTTTDPVCGKCGYIVRGISSLTCPECGSDLREVGIIPPGTQRSIGPVGWCLIWTAVLPLPAIFLSQIVLSSVGPTAYNSTMQRTIFCMHDYPRATLQAKMTGQAIYWGGYRMNPSVPLQQLEIELHGSSRVPPGLKMDVNLVTQVWTVTNANGQTISGSTFDAKAILALLQAAGFDPADQRIRDRAKDILAVVQEIPQAQGKSTQLALDQYGRYGVSAHPTFAFTAPRIVPWTGPVLWAFWLLIWLLGLWRITRSFRRKQTPAALAQPAA